MIRLLCNIVLLKIVIFAASCSSEYVLNGNTDSFFDGARAYLKIEKDGKLLAVDSCDILHGKFSMQGDVDVPFVCALFIGDEAIMPVVLEKGDISVKIGRQDIVVSGTELNNMLSNFMEQKERFERHMALLERKEAQLILEGYTAEGAAAYMRDSLAAAGGQLDSYVEDFIKEHYNTVLGPCVFRLLCSTLPYPFFTNQIERILDDAPEVFLSDDFVKDFVMAAEENMRRLKVD